MTTEAVTHTGVGEVYVAQGVGMLFDAGDLLIYDPGTRGIRTFHPKGTWSEYTVTPDGTCRVVLTSAIRSSNGSVPVSDPAVVAGGGDR